jgi:hypothetical protein
VLQALGQLERAREEFEAVLTTEIKVLGAEHPDTLATRANLAGVLQQLGLADERNA